MMASPWKFNEVGTYIETENEKYAEIISMVERRRTAEKYLKIQKVREEKTVGVRLTRTFFIYKRGNDFGYKKFVLVELVPPPKLYLRDKEFYTTYVGIPFRLPDGYTFKFYENAVECWHHNNILSDQKQLKILLRYNFDKFVRALETIDKPTATTRQYDYNTCMSSISPFSESDDEDSESDSDSDFEVEHNGNEEHDQSTDEMSPFSESGNEEGGSGSDSDYEDECSEEKQHHQSADEITDGEEEIFRVEKEDHDIKFDSEEISDIDLLNCTKEADQKYDSEDDIGLDALFSTEQPIQKCDYNTCVSSISPFSENDEEENKSDSDSDFEVGHSEEEERDQSADEFTDDEEQIYRLQKEDHDTKFCSEDVSYQDLLSSLKEADLKYDSEDEIGLDVLFHKEGRDQKTDLDGRFDLDLLDNRKEQGQKLDSNEGMHLHLLFGVDEMNLKGDSEKDGQNGDDQMATEVVLVKEVEECSEECSYNEEERVQSEEKRDIDRGKVLREEQPHPDAENNDGQFPGVAGQEAAQKQQQQQQERFIEHVHEHPPGKYTKSGTKKRKNIVMGWLCSRVIKVFLKSKVLL